LLAPQIPLIFMGEEVASEAPFLFFCDYHGELADAVREGRRREFANFGAFARAATDIPDPNAISTYEKSAPTPGVNSVARRDLYRRLLALRHAEIVPRLAGTKALRSAALGEAAVSAHWRMGDGTVLMLATNLGDDAVTIDPPDGRTLFESTANAAALARDASLKGQTTVAFLEPPL
jgi:1,4-alpha-glucan branching enzyme